MCGAVLNVARYDAFRLNEAMLAGDMARLARMLEGLKSEGEAPPKILWVLAEEIRAVAKVQAGLAQGEDLQRLYGSNRVWGEARQRAVAGAARRLNPPRWEKRCATPLASTARSRASRAATSGTNCCSCACVLRPVDRRRNY